MKQEINIHFRTWSTRSTYRSVVLVHKVIGLCHMLVDCGLAHREFPEVEELLEGVCWEVFEVGHRPSFGVESHQGAPRNGFVVVAANVGNLLGRISRDEECEFRSLQCLLISEGERVKGEEGIVRKTRLDTLRL